MDTKVTQMEMSNPAEEVQQEISLREEVKALTERLHYLEHSGRLRFISFFDWLNQKKLLKCAILRGFYTTLMFGVMFVFVVLLFYWASFINEDIKWFLEFLGLTIFRRILEAVFYVPASICLAMCLSIIGVVILIDFPIVVRLFHEYEKARDCFFLVGDHNDNIVSIERQDPVPINYWDHIYSQPHRSDVAHRILGYLTILFASIITLVINLFSVLFKTGAAFVVCWVFVVGSSLVLLMIFLYSTFIAVPGMLVIDRLIHANQSHMNTHTIIATEDQINKPQKEVIQGQPIERVGLMDTATSSK